MYIHISCHLAFIILLISCTEGWHSLDNSNFHCWYITANANNPTPYSSCPGINIRWIVPPKSPVKAQESFNVTYELILGSAFWPWAVTNNIFNFNNITTASGAQDFCDNTVCPSSVSAANKENCCIYHVNVHSCHKNDKLQNDLCGPWISPNGTIYTHSQVMAGPRDRGNWTSVIPGLYTEGENSLIAHFKIAKMHVAIEKTVTVNPRTVCGDENCETIEGEDCETCPKDCGRCPLQTWEIALIVVAILIVFIVLGAIVGYFVWKQQKLLWDESWIVSYDKITPDTGVRGFMGSVISINQSMASMTSGVTANKNLTGNSLALNAARKQIFTETGIYDGRTIAVKAIQKRNFALSKSIRKEVKQVRTFDNPNLTRFIGATLEPDRVNLLTEYCPKGSLNDVLMNEDVPLNWAFRFSFASDIAGGMRYLHNNKLYHGRLKSQNCLIDDRWTVKIADYGTPGLRKEQCDDIESVINTKDADIVYRAPEVVDFEHASPTPEADVYAFAIILVEIATRNDPYGDESPDTIKPGWRPPLPDLSQESTVDDVCPCPKDYLKLIQICWVDKPSERPLFADIKKVLHRINPNKLSPVDLMMAMMEKYSKHLESLVGERTADLMLEKQKTDRLLYSMLPMEVANDLRQGKTISAEWFDECTIFFSDIVGFTTLSGSSTPLEVVAFLNKLYICFDSIIDAYDVYKVETIGDAYMVVSGVPKKNGILHGREVANMSLDLVEACKGFVIPHKPQEPLKVRVGLHSGPVCAGVVGLKMPRYCLFGDTVNTASRMESNGEAYKIHMSEFTNDVLCKVGGFHIEMRGSIPIKGKGDMTTYWLTDRDQNNTHKSDTLTEVQS
ncbi:unnamed protein product [Owenia fusiformis]|uniref:Guanylate cyclase n=1 Tax=Owenia fusiformis TaxID=6347 RepID=A0A8J1YB64_OWEFU|nr:unnamed protein product [Owenia fusiformis]